jgi:rSAM/selenodomain-associated transferase 1
VKKVSSKQNIILVFTKGTDFGQVKTRLRPFLNNVQSMELHLAFLQDTLEKIKSLNIHGSLYVVGDPDFHFKNSFPIFPQNGNDLGSRLHNAFEDQFMNHDRIVVIGTDSPDLPTGRIQEAFLSLQNHDAVIGPTEDGGYYLLGLSKMIPTVFETIPWSTNEVFQKTLEKLHGYKTHVLESHYDVDVIEDLIKLKKNLEKEKSIAPFTRKWFDENWNALMLRLNDKLQNAPE